MISFLFIIVCLAAGIMIRRSGILQPGAYKSVNAWILYIAMPACFLRYIPCIRWDRQVMLPLLSPFVVWAGAWAFISLYSARVMLSNGSRGALKLTSGLSNTAFLGFIAVYYSEKEISIAVLYDQVSFLLLSTAGVITAVKDSGDHKVKASILLKRLFRFPPFLACLPALCLPPSFFSPLNPMLDRIAATIGPMALFSIGLQLDGAARRSVVRPLSAGLLYKLCLAPALVLLIVLLTGQRGSIAQISVFESAMPTLATAGVLADEYGLNPPLASLMVGISILFSLVTMGCWWYVLQCIR
ncbi:MAG TPA: AEC family transporter [Puia sp.]|nr:AEC family transporter [Puia sp.]